MKIWFQNRRAKWKRVKAGISSSGHRLGGMPGGPVGGGGPGGHGPGGGGGLLGGGSGGAGICSGGGAAKIVVPIPVHVSRQFAMRNQVIFMYICCRLGISFLAQRNKEILPFCLMALNQNADRNLD